MNPWLVGLAQEAGRMALGFLRDGFDVKIKPDKSPVTTADLAIDAFLHREIKAKFPEDVVLSEESEDDPGRLGARRVWIADPIDGTAYFAAKKDGFGTLISLCIDGEATESVAHFPMSSLTLYAKLGDGAYVNGRRVSVSKLSGPDAKVVSNATQFKSLNSTPMPVRNNAMIVFKVIAGELEGCVATTSPSAGEHDYAWASCAVAAAGGQLTDANGGPLRYNKPVRTMPRVLIGSNGLIHDSLVEKVRALSGNAP